MAKAIFFTLAKLAKVIFALGGSQKGGGCVTTGLPWLVVTEGQLDLVKVEVASQLAYLGWLGRRDNWTW